MGSSCWKPVLKATLKCINLGLSPPPPQSSLSIMNVSLVISNQSQK